MNEILAIMLIMSCAVSLTLFRRLQAALKSDRIKEEIIKKLTDRL